MTGDGSGTNDCAPRVASQDPGEPGGLAGIVHRDRIALDKVHLGGAVVCGGDLRADPFDRLAYPSTGLLGHATDGALEEGSFGDHVGGRAGFDVCHGDERRIEGVDLAGHCRLDRRDHGGHRRTGSVQR